MSITDRIKEWTEGVPVEHSARQQLTGSHSERFISVKTLQQDAYISDITIDSNWRSHDDESSY
jgi:hypothetical protein